MNTINLRGLALGVVLGAGLALQGCSDSSGGSDSHAASSGPKACQAVAGPLDPAQMQMVQLSLGLLQVPTVGLALDDMANAVIGMTDAVDSLTVALASLQSNPDPTALANNLASLGPSVDCAATQAQSALGVFEATGAFGSDNPLANSVGPLLAQLQGLRDQVAGSGASAPDLDALASQLADLSTALNSFAAMAPVQIPMLGDLAGGLAAASSGLSSALTSTSALDATGVQTAVTGLMTALGVAFPNIPTGIPELNALSAQVHAALAQIAGPLQTALGQILPPVFTALSQVLTPVGGGDVLAGVIAGVLGGDTDTSGLSTLLDQVTGGGTVGNTQIPLLSDLLGLI